MRIAVVNPLFLLRDQRKNFNGYDYLFFMDHIDVIYLSDPRRYFVYKSTVKNLENKNIKIIPFGFMLNKYADVLISFNGIPNRIQHRIPKHFKGLKICHIMDYVFYASNANKALIKDGVNYLLGYCKHDQYSDFFRHFYPTFSNKVIPVPFGYGERFQNLTDFKKRKNKAIALGSVNPVNEGDSIKLHDYIKFYKNEKFTHKLRRAIVENRNEWVDYIDDLLPTYPDTKNPYYDSVSELNKYTMFINDAGLMNFPPARTYEGIACGCVMVAEDLEIYKELGFVNEKNCILFEKGDYDGMIKKIKYYMTHVDELVRLQKNSLLLAQNYTHQRIANGLFKRIETIYHGDARR